MEQKQQEREQKKAEEAERIVQMEKLASEQAEELKAAITAATKTCDLVLNVTGATHRINTLFQVEVERIVAVYHYYRKMAKTATAQPQTIVPQAQTDPLKQLEELSKLKKLGVITVEEFSAKKALISKL